MFKFKMETGFDNFKPNEVTKEASYRGIRHREEFPPASDAASILNLSYNIL